MTPQMDEAEYQAGHIDGLVEYFPGELAGDPVGVSDDYRAGWWCGVGDAMAFHEGWNAAEKGILACPYIVGADDECFRDQWHDGYFACWDALKKMVAQ